MEDKRGIIYSIIYSTIKRRRVTILIMILIFIGGLYSYIKLPKEEYPIVEMPVAIITAIYPGASAEDMEELVTSKIEEEAMATEGFEYCSSESFNSVSVVKVNLNKDLDKDTIDNNFDDLRDRLEDLHSNDLPSGVTKLNINTDIMETAGLILAFTGEDKSNRELVQRAEELKEKLIDKEGIKRVEVSGELEEQVEVTIDANKLNLYNLSLSNICSIIGAENSMIPIGDLEFQDNKFKVNSSGRLGSIEEIEDIIIHVSTDTGAVIKLKDIGVVEKVVDEDSKSYKYNGEPAVLLNVYYDEGINVLDKYKEIQTEVDKFKENLSSDIHMNTVISLADDVNSSINDFVINLIESIVIVLLVVMIGMSITNGIIVTVAIPLSIFMTFIIMRFLEVNIQFVSLASLIVALGMLVDNAILVGDAIQTRFDQGEERLEACIRGTKEVAIPALASTLTTAIIFSMFFMLPGTMATFVFSLPAVVITTLFSSYFVSIFFIPVMCYFLIKKSKVKKEKDSHIRRVLTKLLEHCLIYKKATLIITLATVLGGGLLLLSLNTQFLPKAEKNVLDITVTTNNLRDIRKTEEIIDKIETILKEQPELEYYLASVGGKVPKYDFTAVPSADSVNTGSFFVKIDLKKGKRFKDKGDFTQYIQNILNKEVAGARIQVKEMNIVPRQDEQIQIRICGTDLDELNDAADQLEHKMNDMGGFKNVYSDRKIKNYNYFIDIKNDMLNSVGLTKAEVQNELNIALMGRTASIFRKNSKEYPIVVKSNISELSDLQNYQVLSSITGSKYKMSQISNISLEEEYSSITRYNGKRAVTLSADAKEGFSPIALQTKLKDYCENNGFSNISFEYEGDTKIFMEVTESLGLGAVLGTFLIFLLLFIQFDSFKNAFVIMLSMLFSVIGAAIGLKVFKQDLSIFALIGIISLIGVVVKNAIVLVDFINGERDKGVSLDTACSQAVDRRFRPIILSTATTVLGLLPLAIFGNVIFKTLSITFMCGLAGSLVFTLVVTPVIYSMLHK